MVEKDRWHPYGNINPCDSVKIADRVLNEYFDTAIDLNIKAFLVYGTCLGFVRDGGYIQDDNDLDVGMLGDFDKLKKELIKRGFSHKRDYNHNSHFLKDGILLDVHFDFYKAFRKYLHRFETIAYKGNRFKVPFPITIYLEDLYDDWRKRKPKGMKEYSILIVSYKGNEVIELCLESILKRTKGTNYKINVLDSSPSDHPDKAYLRDHEAKGNIKLLESEKKLSHGEGLARLIKECDTDWAVLLDSDCEILKGDWITVLKGEIQSNQDLGVSRFRHGGIAKDLHCIAPVFWPATMLLNVKLYRNFEEEDDWSQRNEILRNYKYRHIYDKKGYYHGGYIVTKPHNRELRDDAVVWRDTSWRFTEKVLFETDGKYKIRPMPQQYWDTKVRHYGGLTRNHWRRESHPMVKPRWDAICKNLAELRKEK